MRKWYGHVSSQAPARHPTAGVVTAVLPLQMLRESSLRRLVNQQPAADLHHEVAAPQTCQCEWRRKGRWRGAPWYTYKSKHVGLIMFDR